MSDNSLAIFGWCYAEIVAGQTEKDYTVNPLIFISEVDEEIADTTFETCLKKNTGEILAMN